MNSKYNFGIFENHLNEKHVGNSNRTFISSHINHFSIDVSISCRGVVVPAVPLLSKDQVAVLVDSICVLGDISSGYEKVL